MVCPYSTGISSEASGVTTTMQWPSRKSSFLSFASLMITIIRLAIQIQSVLFSLNFPMSDTNVLAHMTHSNTDDYMSNTELRNNANI